MLSKEETKLLHMVLYHYWYYRILMEISGKYEPNLTMSPDEFNHHMNVLFSVYNHYRDPSYPSIESIYTLPRFGFTQ